MRIEYYHASEFGNGIMVADEFKRLMAARGAEVGVHHMKDTDPRTLAPADLYVFSSPGRLGKPIRRARGFLKKVNLPSGTKYAIMATEATPRPDAKTGKVPNEEELAHWQKVRPIMNELLQEKGLVKVAEGVVYVNGVRGPLEEGWQKKVEDFASSIPA
jgi:hypothetical protein